jgi:demethylmenaquinone methyltransferase/2-methoxy-6-polyprenyl-1,4-benzoquinol methylase
MSYYDDISEGYDELHGEEQLKKAKIILSRLNLKKTDKLLDVGCGTGRYLDMFNCHVTGIDPALELIKQYRGRHKLMMGRAEEIRFPEESFNIIISLTAVHNFEDIKKGLKEIERVGKDRYILSILKRSPKFDIIEKLIKEIFIVNEIIDEDKDIIFFCKKKNKRA